MDSFTPTSGAGFDSNGAFNLGMEVFFNTPASPSVVVKEFDIPTELSFIRVFGGSAAMRPKDPTSGTFGTWKYFKADVLFRVMVDGITIINTILKSSMEPQNISISGFDVNLKTAGVEGRKMKVEFQEAGAALPVNAELQICGMWS